MQSNYRRLGDYIRLVNVRNTDNSITELLGINIDKFFMPSVANVVGTDLSKYKVVSKNQFACNRMHVGRDYRIPIAKSDSTTKFIVSPAYDVFEIIDESEVLPDYLMLWFKRKEFDRNAWFYTDADVRGGLSWAAFANIQFPLISIEKQKEIIAEYEAVEQRIQLNNTLCEKLEETAQTLYRHWFEDFEFPHSPPFKEGCPKGGVVTHINQESTHVGVSQNSPPQEEGWQSAEGIIDGVVTNSHNSPPFKEGCPKGGVVNNIPKHNLPQLKTFRKQLRNNLTPAEATLWKALQRKQLDGRKFRRQHSVDHYVLDFYCPSEKLAVEVDGQGHYDMLQQEYDEERTAFMKRYGIKVIRFENKLVFTHQEMVVEAIRQEFGWYEREFLQQDTAAECVDHHTLQSSLLEKEVDHPALQAPLLAKEGNSAGYKSSGGEMVYSEELGKEIPKGWRVYSLSEVVKSNQKNISANSQWQFINYLDTSNITNNKIDEIQYLNVEVDEIPSRAKRLVEEKDIIYSTVRPNLKHYGIFYEIPENFVVSTGFIVISTDGKIINPEVIYQFLTSENIVKKLHAKAENSVTTYPSIKPEDILNLQIALPQSEIAILDAFENVYKKIKEKTKQNRKLEELKSLLLGKMAVEGYFQKIN